MNPLTPVLATLLLLVASFPYVQRARHPETRLLAAYLLYVGTFVLVTAVAYFVVGWLVAWAGLGEALTRPWGAALFLILVFVPAFAIARWQIKRPPMQSPLPR
jgi:hypothetical protein